LGAQMKRRKACFHSSLWQDLQVQSAKTYILNLVGLLGKKMAMLGCCWAMA
jgi:hypothetical protein